MIYYIQILSILFAIGLAKHDAPAVTDFEHDGADPKQMSKFHRYGVWSKLFFCIAVALIPHWEFVVMVKYGLLSGLLVWLVFDPVVNLARYPKRNWYYLGKNDADGRRWIKLFGEGKAGKIKAIVLGILILGINIFYQKIKRP